MAKAHAAVPSRLIKIDRVTFELILGPLQTVMKKREAEEYEPAPKIEAGSISYLSHNKHGIIRLRIQIG